LVALFMRGELGEAPGYLKTVLFLRKLPWIAIIVEMSENLEIYQGRYKLSARDCTRSLKAFYVILGRSVDCDGGF
jgi:hypothetical protein